MLPNPLTPDDAGFLADFESGKLEKAKFKHRDHVRLAWILLRVSETAEARARVERGIRAFATLHGVPGLFHVTVTEAWMRVVRRTMAVAPAEEWVEVPLSFDTWISSHAELLDGGLLARHYSDAVLKSDAARVGWVEPDLRPIADDD
jgi:hypothetical protein